MTRPTKKPILVLNADRWTPLRRQDFNEVISNLISGTYKIRTAVKGEYVQGPIQPDGSRFQIPWPGTVYVNRWVHIDFKKIAPKDTVLASRIAILHRDLFECQYCGDDAGTWDHIVPQSKGGENTWLNLVAACTLCNGFKADREPEEAERDLQVRLADPNLTDEERAKLPPTMKLRRQPFIPDHDPYRREQKDIWRMLQTGELIDMEED